MCIVWGKDQNFFPPYKYPISWAPLIEKTVHFPPFCHTTFARNEACMRLYSLFLFYCTFAHLVPTQQCLIWCLIIYLICVVYVLQICYFSSRLSFLFLCSTFSCKFFIQLINLYKIGGSGWRGRWEGGSGWGRHVNSRTFHFNLWKKKKERKKKKRHAEILIRILNFISFWRQLIFFFTVFCLQYWFFQSIYMLYLLTQVFFNSPL